MSWHLAPALVQLRAEVNARWPKRSKRSDGTIGDAAHSARRSDHNPNSRRSVNAIDITADGVNVGAIIAAAKKHPSVRYIIYNRRIMNRDVGNFAPRRYRGANLHTAHVHISLYQSRKAEQRRQSWGIAGAKAAAPKAGSRKPAPKPAPKRTGRVPGPGHAFPLPARHYFGPKDGGNKSVSGFYSRKFKGKTDRWWLQEFGRQLARRGWSLGYGKTWLGRTGNDGKYGPEYAALIRRFQQDQRIGVDGLLGKKTWDAAFKNPIS